MSVEDLLSFLHNVQNNVEATEEYCRSVIERFEPSEEGKNQLLSLDGMLYRKLTKSFVIKITCTYACI